MHSRSPWKSALLATSLAAATLLASCGGSSSSDATAGSSSTTTQTTVAGVDIGNVSAAQLEAAKALKHRAALGVLVGAKVQVRNALDASETVLYETVTDNDGQYSVVLPAYAPNTIFRVTVSGGADADVNDTGKRDAVPTPFLGEINALVDANDLLNGSIRVTMLSDAAYRMLGGNLASFDAAGLNIELNRIAGKLLKHAVGNPDKPPVSSDLLQFDATLTEHRAALAFDFTSLQQALEGEASQRSLLQKYHAGDKDMAAAWRTITSAVPGLQKTLAEEMNRNTVKFQAGVSGKGSITGSPLPGGTFGDAAAPYSTVLPRDGSTVSLQATETDAEWKFHSWIGCKLAAGTRCDVDLSQDVSAIARFMLKQPVVLPTVTSLGRLVPQDSMTGIRFNADGTATIVSRDAATVSFMKSIVVGTMVQTGQVDHPTVRVTAVVAAATTVTANAPDATTAPMTTMTFGWEEASPVDVYDKISIIAEATPLAFDEVRAIQVGDGVSGSVRTVLPPPDFTASVVAGSVIGPAPTWYVTLAADGSCRGFGDDATARASLQTAWEAAPRGYPFTATALVNCVANGRFSIAGDLTDYVMAKSLGDTDQFSGRHDGAGKLSMRVRKGLEASTRLASAGGTRQAEQVWISGVGVAVPLGKNLYLASREDGPGMRLVALQDTVKITTKDAVRLAQSDCAMRGLPSACGLLAGLDRERQGLRNVGSIPLLGSPLKVTLKKPGTNLVGTVSLSLDIDLRPNASFDWSLSGVWLRASAGANYQIKPELGLKVAYGNSVDAYLVPAARKNKKFDKKNAKATAKGNKKNVSNTLISIDLGRAIPYAGAVLDLSLNLVVGLDVGGNITVTVTPALTLAGDFGMRAYYEWRCCRSNDRELSTWFNMPTKQPSLSADMKGSFEVEPYAELNLSAGLRGVAPEIAKILVRGGVAFTGDASTGFSYATKFRSVVAPSTWSEGAANNNSTRYWESCSLDTRRTNPSSCTCSGDQVEKRSLPFFGSFNVVVKKCVNRGTPVLIPGLTTKIPQRCVDSPELSLGLTLHAKSSVEISSSKFKKPFNGWLDFINRSHDFFDKEWPIWEYPQKDNQPEGELVGCKDIT